MWQQEKKDTSIIRLLLWVALAATPIASTLVLSAPMLAQSKPETPSFVLPKTVQNGSTLRIDGSSTLGGINQSLKESFEKQFTGTKIEVATNGTGAALKELLDGKIDIVAMGRGLTPAEKAQGLEQVRLRREKIAIVVGADNPFKGSLTSKQFARIFRGQITDWSQVGGPAGKIRLIDRPNTSETRNTFRTYPAFKNSEFTTGANATQIADDNTAEIIKNLDKDGISYVLANQVSKLQNVRILQLHQASPDDAKYPFSQPLVYVYKKNPNLTTVDFLGFTLAPPGQQAIEKARTAEAEAIAANISPAAVTPPATAETTPPATTSVFGKQPFVASPAPQKAPIVNKEVPFWVLLPLFFITVGGAVFWWIVGKRPSSSEKTGNLPEPNPYLPDTEDREMALLNASTSSSINGTILDEQPIRDFQDQETHDRARPASSDRTPFNIYAQTESDLTHNGTQGTSNLVSESTNGTSNLYEDSTSSGSGAAALSGGAAIATGIGAATWSAFNNQETETEAINETGDVSNYPAANTLDSDENAWDIEAPAAVVNSSYPHLGNISEEASDLDLPSSELIAPLPELPDVPEITSDFGYWDTELSKDENQIDEELQAELKWLESITSTEDPAAELPLQESEEAEPLPTQTSSLLHLPEVPEDIFNVVADAAEPSIDVVNEESQPEPTVEQSVAETDSANFAGVGALAAGAGIGAWATIASGVDNNVPAAETDTHLPNAEEESSILLTPHTSTLAHVSWEISETKKAALHQQGGSQLAVRLYDATGIDLSYQSPHLIHQYVSEETAHDRLLEIPLSDRDYIAEIGYIAEGDRWLFIARSLIVRFFGLIHPDPIAAADKTNIHLPDTQQEIGGDESSLVLTPRTSQWADVSWEISETKKAALRQQGGSQLAVRLYDATGIDLSYQSPHLVQQYECDETAHDRFVEIPISDRDYIAEIGYVADNNRWLLIAHSAIVRVFSPVPPDSSVAALATEPAIGLVHVEENSTEEESKILFTPRTPKWAYVSWHISPTQKQALQQQGGSQLVVRLYDVTGIDLSYQNPQLVQQYECEEVASDRFVAIPVSDRDYMIEIGYIADSDRWLLIASSPYVRVFSRSHEDFWFVADAELIIHGATQPNTSVNIGGHNIKIKPDGTFHLRLPFSDGLMDYLITVANEGESTKTIHKKFSQQTSES